MSDKVYITPQPIIPYKPAGKGAIKELPGRDVSFTDTLDAVRRKQGELKFSAHALERLQQRNLRLQELDLSKIGEAVDRARLKGVTSSLVLLDDVALIASVKNNTIITVVDKQGLKEHVFTGIDGAVIVE